MGPTVLEVFRLVITKVKFTSTSSGNCKDQEIFSGPGAVAIADRSVGGGGGPA